MPVTPSSPVDDGGGVLRRGVEGGRGRAPDCGGGAPNGGVCPAFHGNLNKVSHATLGSLDLQLWRGNTNDKRAGPVKSFECSVYKVCPDW